MQISYEQTKNSVLRNYVECENKISSGTCPGVFSKFEKQVNAEFEVFKIEHDDNGEVTSVQVKLKNRKQ
jgi:hypothetical protein